MNLLKKAAISLAATSMLAAPIAASAQSFELGSRQFGTQR